MDDAKRREEKRKFGVKKRRTGRRNEDVMKKGRCKHESMEGKGKGKQGTRDEGRGRRKDDSEVSRSLAGLSVRSTESKQAAASSTQQLRWPPKAREPRRPYHTHTVPIPATSQSQYTAHALAKSASGSPHTP